MFIYNSINLKKN